ncbi:MAG: endo-1,4-beta-xylanase, partial [Clostridia bacterium]|nr:endo-1,4-beta-xylanase [Clostridia bacterium]
LGGYGQQGGCMAESLITDLNRAIDIYIKRGYEVQITEMAVRNYDPGLAAEHAEFYGRLFSEIFMQKNSEESNPLTAVCIWGLRDANPAIQDYDYNLNSSYGCLLTSDCKIKTCFDTVYHVLKGD